MRPTRVRDLFWPALLTAAVVGLLVQATYDSLPPIAWSAPASLALLTAVEWSLGSTVRARMRGEPGTKPIVPLTVARVAALAKASSLGADIVLGAWMGAEAFLLAHLSLAHARADALRAGLGVLVSALLLVAALRLEGVCKVPRPPGGPPPAGGAGL